EGGADASSGTSKSLGKERNGVDCKGSDDGVVEDIDAGSDSGSSSVSEGRYSKLDRIESVRGHAGVIEVKGGGVDAISGTASAAERSSERNMDWVGEAEGRNVDGEFENVGARSGSSSATEGASEGEDVKKGEIEGSNVDREMEDLDSCSG
ncbi:hypothetical protein BJY52DRAFT_1308317, partial [Lactarius psammicola]